MAFRWQKIALFLKPLATGAGKGCRRRRDALAFCYATRRAGAIRALSVAVWWYWPCEPVGIKISLKIDTAVEIVCGCYLRVMVMIRNSKDRLAIGYGKVDGNVAGAK